MAPVILEIQTPRFSDFFFVVVVGFFFFLVPCLGSYTKCLGVVVMFNGYLCRFEVSLPNSSFSQQRLWAS